MLKGVGRARVCYRQHLQQASVQSPTCCNTSCGTIQLVIRTKSSAAALDSGAKLRNAEYSSSRPLLDTTSRSPRERSTKSGQAEIKESQKPSSLTYSLSHLPPDVLHMINSLFAKKSHTSMLKHIRSSPLSEHFLDRTKATKLAEAMVQTQSPQRASRILLLAHGHGCPLKQNAYECVAYRLAEAKHWHLIPPLVAVGKRQTGRTTVRLLNWRTRAIIESTHYGRLETVLDEFERENLKPNRRTFHLLISGHIRNHNLRLARESLKKMQDAGISVDATTHSTVVSVYRSFGPAAEVQRHAFEALRNVSGRTSTITLNSLMQIYMDANDVHGIIRALSFFHQGDTDVTLSDEFGRRFLPRGRNGPFDDHPVASSTLTQAAQASIMPDVATFTILINYMTRRHDLSGVPLMLERMVAMGLRPDAAAAAAIIRAYFSAGREHTAVHIIADMCRAHKVPSLLFRPFDLTFDRVDQFSFRFSDIPLTTEIFNALMRSALNSHSLKGARTVLRIMRACNVKPDTKTIEIFMNHLAYAKRARPRDLIRVLKNLSSATVPPSLNHIHIIMKSVLRREKFLLHGSGWNAAAAKFSPRRQDLSRYPEGRISGTATSFDPTAGIELPRKLSYRALIRPIVQSLTIRGIKSNKATIALRLRHEAVNKSNLTTANQVFQQMLARGMHPTAYHFTALMEGHALSGDLRSAENVMGSALDAGIPPNIVMFTILIVGHARLGHPDRAMRTFQGMVTAGIRPDVPVVDAIASAYFAVGAYRIAKRVLLNLWPYVQAPPEGMQMASLKQLAMVFRAPHAKRDPSNTPKRLNKSEQRVLRWKINRLITSWKRVGSPLSERKRSILLENIQKRKRKTTGAWRT
jgi:pentatricopeptide repeat protein